MGTCTNTRAEVREMYIVVSKWEINAGHREDFRSGPGREMRVWLRSRPEVEFVHEFETEEGNAIAIVAYKDEESYRKLILEPGSAFDQKMSEMNLSEVGNWLWSERGTPVDDPVTV